MIGDRRCRKLVGSLHLAALAWAFASLAVPDEILGQTGVGSEFQVNSYTSDSQTYASVTIDAAGNFVVVWTSNLQDGSSEGVFGQRFSSTGAALGGEFQVNELTFGPQAHPSVASDGDGDFVVAWESGGQDYGDFGIFARRFSSAGAPVGSEFQVNSYTTYNQDYPSVAAKPDGEFVVVWQSQSQDDGEGYESYGVFGQRFSSAGTLVGSEFQVNTVTADHQFFPSVAIAADGRFVVAWAGYVGSPEAVVFAQRFSSEGAPLGGEIQVGTYTVGHQQYPAVAVHADGGFVVAWQGYGYPAGYYYRVFSRRFSSVGSALGAELQIDSHSDGGAFLPAVAAAPDGGFMVVWAVYNATEQSAVARRYDSAGSPLAIEFQVNSYTDSPNLPVIAIDGAGDFVVAWQSYGQEGEVGKPGIFAQRFALSAPDEVELDIDGDGQTEALTDGLLVLRRLFLFTGATLTTGAVDTQNCTRCDAAAIEPYIAGLGLALDIDGDGAVEPLSDGILVLRYLFGFTGATLTSGAVDTQNCTRCDAAAIEPYLMGLTS